MAREQMIDFDYLFNKQQSLLLLKTQMTMLADKCDKYDPILDCTATCGTAIALAIKNVEQRIYDLDNPKTHNDIVKYPNQCPKEVSQNVQLQEQ